MYIFLKLVIKVLETLPLTVLQFLGSNVGRLAWYVIPSRRKVAIINAEIIGVSNPRQVAKKSFQHTFMSYFESVHHNKLDDKFLATHMDEIENREIVDEFIAEGKEFIFITAHIGAWELGLIASNIFPLKFSVVGRDSKHEWVNRLIHEQRNTKNVAYFSGAGSLEKLAEYDKKGYINAVLLDHSTTRNESILSPFFGYNVRTLVGFPAKAVRRNIPLIAGYLIRTDKGNFRFEISGPIYPNMELKPRERIRDLCTRMNQEYERIITKYPEQWYLLHKRFKKIEISENNVSEYMYKDI